MKALGGPSSHPAPPSLNALRSPWSLVRVCSAASFSCSNSFIACAPLPFLLILMGIRTAFLTVSWLVSPRYLDTGHP